MKILRKLFFISFLIVLACDDEKKVDNKPQNLSFTVDVATDGSGEVTVQATAENAETYLIYFGETVPETPVTSTDGSAEYKYAESGTYTIQVLASNTTTTSTVTETKPVTVEVSLIIPAEGYTTPQTYEGMNLVWQDEFSGQTINETDWTFETGGGGWGNNELQYYQKQNANIQDGHLVITAKKESVGGREYTSTRMITKNKQTFKYGRIDIRAMLPKGQGIWPALWMLGNNIDAVNWPKCGEIDIMEMIGGVDGVGAPREKTVYGTLHWDDGGRVCTCDKPGYSLSSGTFNDKFHVFSIIWDETQIRWFVDDVEFHPISITPEHMTEFHEEFFFIFNVAVGGNWPGNPNSSTTFPQRMIVDYVRVFQEQ